ncbi:hypothetical protein OMP44_15590 [Pseudomonas sp. CBMAI 2609]|uniref:Uncharacterized protein n=1 Tax=Pseudomonas flavocrustae TaxID=2991719 RepID=A0ABT6IIK8_9PSED|nr:hypothetical protein [Pseudomonas sp. CBMAI 2609]MDH4764313.1 hypothetical protein [Pseudomonas sp. CBMAI 2609]
MRENLHPSVLEPRLTAEYVSVVCNEALDAAYLAIEAASTDDDTTWTVGTLTYGRVQGRFKTMSHDPELPWFRLANSTMDYTPSINGVLLQVVMDDPARRKKSHRLSPNGVERFQASLLGMACDRSLTWRLYIDSDLNPDGRKLTATVMGFDSNLNVMCQWVHNYVPLISVRTSELPQEVEIQDPQPQRRKKDAEQDKPNDTRINNE